MSRVTLSDLVADYKHDGFEERYPHPIHHVEIVPRKIVEMIIDKCTRDESEPAYSNATQEEATDIRKYAERLLEQFEGND